MPMHESPAILQFSCFRVREENMLEGEELLRHDAAAGGFSSKDCPIGAGGRWESLQPSSWLA